MTMTASFTIMDIELTNGDGYEINQSVSVCLDYIQEVDWSYGEDADGHQGSMRVEYTILDAWIEASDLKALTAAQAAWAIDEAKYIFTTTKKHW